MDAIYVGVDVSKDRLDVHVRPSGLAFVVSRDGKGLEELVERLRKLSPVPVTEAPAEYLPWLTNELSSEGVATS